MTVKCSHQSSTNTTTQLKMYGMWLRSCEGSVLWDRTRTCHRRTWMEWNENREKISASSAYPLADLHPLSTQLPASGLTRRDLAWGHGSLLWGFFLRKGSSKLKHQCCGTRLPADSALAIFSPLLSSQLLTPSWPYLSPSLTIRTCIHCFNKLHCLST